MNKRFQMMIGSFLVLGLSACSSTEEKQVEQKVDQAVQAEKAVTQKGELSARGADVFMSAPGLTEGQKSKLMEVHAKAAAEAQAIGAELGQTKTALFKNLVSTTSSTKETAALKKKIVALDKKRLDTMFKALDEVQKIVGKNEQSENVYKEFYRFEMMNKGDF